MHKKTVSMNNRLGSTSDTEIKLMRALTETSSKDKNNENAALMAMFLKKLETIGETIEDLKEVAKLVPEYSKEQVITEEAAGAVKPDTFKALTNKILVSKTDKTN